MTPQVKIKTNPLRVTVSTKTHSFTWEAEAYDVEDDNKYWSVSGTMKTLSSNRVSTLYGISKGFLEGVVATVTSMQTYERTEQEQSAAEHRWYFRGYAHGVGEFNAAFNRQLGQTIGADLDEIPECLKIVPNVRREDLFVPARVYFLTKATDSSFCKDRDTTEEVVYVGQTIAPWPARIKQHIGEKDFDKVYSIVVRHDQLSEVESMYIHQMKPVYNTMGVSQ
jgi:hypothetical protein